MGDGAGEGRLLWSSDGARSVLCRLRWSAGAESWYRVAVRSAVVAADGSGGDYFDALCELRRRLEEAGWRLAVQGARVDVYPSAMGRDAGGRRAYLLRHGRRPAIDDLVDVFAPADAGFVGTVEDQRRYFDAWRATPAEGDTP